MTFAKVEEKFKQKLHAFAEGGYRFNDEYTLYKQSQQEAFQGYKDGLSKGEKHGYIELPTGVGKTALFISLIKNYLDAANGDENAPRVLIAVPTEKLAVQTAQAIAKFMPDIAKTIETDSDKGQEIDWEKSNIGLQYGRMKHAHKKPKVLITTYQSLARDTANTTYPPEDYGFVIYDEGHVITAPSFGKAVAKFHDSIQLAVTATPEYTETKTVASRLPHNYFELPLAQAINRGDLCNVRPAIIKTGYKIDEDLFQHFIDQQGGTPLNTEQLQQLLNQEARNKAVVETYMRGADPDSGERYFGQNGMIFCTGIKHADAIAAQFTKAMGHGEGIKLRQWLDRENVELIASVHGQSQGQWLKKGLIEDAPKGSRKYEGNREWYSEQEIFDLHEQGKILLLASVAKLKVGYDSPRDSLLFDLADRFSKVDATQIDGRAFRLDPQNPDKTATVFNLMDENTLELYAKYPKLIPIYCAEVIEGAEFRPPARRTGAQIHFKEPPPGMDASLQQAGFDVVTNIDAVRTISRSNKERREKAMAKMPPAPDGWKHGKMLMEEFVGNGEAHAAKLVALQAQKLAEGVTPEDVQSHWVGLYAGNNGSPTLYASPEAVTQLGLTSRGDQAPSAPEGWKNGSMLMEEFVGTNTKFIGMLDALRERKLADGMAPEEVQGRWVGKYAAKNGNPGLYASPEAVAEMGLTSRANQVPSAPEGWKSGKMLSKEFVGGGTTHAAKLDVLRAQKLVEGIAPEEVQNSWVGTYSNHGTVALYASPKALGQLNLTPRSVQAPSAPDGWKNGYMLSKEFIGGDKMLVSKLEALRAQKLAEGVAQEEVQARWIGTYTGKQGASGLYASSEAVEQLGLTPINLAPLAPEGWKSSSMLIKEFVGGESDFIARLNVLRERKLAEGMAPEEVQGRWMGMYSNPNGRKIVYASPEAVAELGLISRSDQAPPAPEGWKNSTMLSEEFVGSLDVFVTKLNALREQKLVEGIKPEEVQNSWVGSYSRKGKLSLYASPEAVAQLELTSRTDQAPPAPDGWKSGKMLSKEFVGGDKVFAAKLGILREQKLAEGITSEEVQNSWVGTYSRKGKPSLCASPKAIAELKLTPRTDQEINSSHSARVGTHSIKPSSDHLKRTGRVRAKDEE